MGVTSTPITRSLRCELNPERHTTLMRHETRLAATVPRVLAWGTLHRHLTDEPIVVVDLVADLSVEIRCGVLHQTAGEDIVVHCLLREYRDYCV